MRAATLSYQLYASSQRHIAGFPLRKVLTYAAWLVMLAIPVGIMVHHEVTVSAPSRRETESVLAEVEALKREMADYERITGRKLK